MNKIYEDLTIVTVLYDSSELINDLLKNVVNFKVIIVDNGNNEQILKNLSNFKNIKVISRKENLGYGKAINFAFEHVKSKYFFVLNPDLVISEKSIYDLYTLITKNPDAGIVAPITEPDEDFYGLFPEKNTKKKLRPNEIKCQNLLKDSKIEGEICVEVAKGCALLLNSEHFKKVGKFDERYFLFWEEIDLCRRFRSKKLSVIVDPSSLATHQQGQSSKKGIKNFMIKTFYSEYSPLIYFNIQKLSVFLIYKQIRYLFRSVTYLLILNIKKSFINLIKLYANIRYFFDLKSSLKK
mgnify:CR=1 FL=1